MFLITIAWVECQGFWAVGKGSRNFSKSGDILNPGRPLIIKLKISETRMLMDLKKKQV